MTTSPRATHPGGFSLPEVTIAMGIAALGLISLLGLMPQGLEMARKTGEMAARRHIMEQITRDLEQTSWSELDTLAAAPGPVRFFDDQGIEVVAGAPAFSYTVKVTVNQHSDGTSGATDSAMVHFPGASQNAVAAQSERYLRKVTVKIATSTNPAFDFSDANNARYATFQTFIAKTR